MSEPKQIIQVIGQMVRGGAECWLMDVLRRIDRGRFQFTFCTLRADPGVFDDEIRSLGGRVVPCPLAGGRRTFAKRFAVLLKEGRFDVIHSHVLFFTGYILRLAARVGVPIRIAHAHTTQDRQGDSLGRRVYRSMMRRAIAKNCTHGIGCSAEAADFLFGRRWRDDRRYHVSPCAVDPSAFATRADRTELCQTLGIPTDARIVGHVGGFRYQKNHAFLLRIAACMMDRDSRIHLLLIGDGPLRTEIEEQARCLGISDRITFAGVRGDVPVLLGNLFDLFLLPSCVEGLSVAAVEAQCAGVASLVSDVLPKEVAIVDQLVSFESVHASPEVWARRALHMLDRPPYDKNRARTMVEHSPFNISASVDFLSGIYSDRQVDQCIP